MGHKSHKSHKEGNAGGKVKSSALQSDLFLIKPKHRSSAYELVYKTLAVSGVRKVLVGEGDYGMAIEASKESTLEDYLGKNKIRYSRIYCLYAFRGVPNGSNKKA